MSECLANGDKVTVMIGGVTMKGRVAGQDNSYVHLDFISSDDVYSVDMHQRVIVSPESCHNLRNDLNADLAALEIGPPYNNLTTGRISLRNIETGG